MLRTVSSWVRARGTLAGGLSILLGSPVAWAVVWATSCGQPVLVLDGAADSESQTESEGDGVELATARDGSLTAGTRCKALQDRLIECELLSDGQFGCGEPATAPLRCETECIMAADCDALRRILCFGQLEATLDECFQQCNGVYECPDGKTRTGVFALCDGVVDCPSGADELECDQFECDSIGSVPLTFRCNRSEDCFDASDEVDCDYFVCDNGLPITARWECDHQSDCIDGSDEHSGCASLLCDPNP